MSRLVVLYPGQLSQEARDVIGSRMEEWAKDRSQPLVLDSGMQLATIGGMVWQWRVFGAGIAFGTLATIIASVLL